MNALNSPRLGPNRKFHLNTLTLNTLDIPNTSNVHTMKKGVVNLAKIAKTPTGNVIGTDKKKVVTMKIADISIRKNVSKWNNLEVVQMKIVNFFTRFVHFPKTTNAQTPNVYSFT